MVLVEKDPMFRQIQHIVVGLLLTSYLFVGAVAHLESIGRFFQFDSKPEKVEQQRPTQPMPERVYWTQHKHIPAFTKVVSFSPATVTPCELLRLELLSPQFATENTEAVAFFVTACAFSRAPPLSAETS